MLRLFHKSRDPHANLSQWMKRDIHCHLLPGIDDGAPDIDTSLGLISQMKDAGLHDFICTPHIISDLYRNSPETIKPALHKLQKACRKQRMDVNFSAAAEYMLDDHFMQLLKSGKPLLTLKKNYLLIETPFNVVPQNLQQMVFEIQTNGYLPIMAHPERMNYLHTNYDSFFRMKELGLALQMNLLSVTGYYGGKVASAAKFLLRESLVDYIGTDLHHQRHADVLTQKRSIRLFEKYLGDKTYNDFS